MTKQRKAQVVTVLVLLGAVAMAVGRKGGASLPVAAPQQDPTPQDAIYAMLDAARAGDVPAYRAAYSGQMAEALAGSLRETTPEAFAKYLQDSNATIKGVAISEPQPLTDREVKVKVEYVYNDRNEVQTMFLEKQAGRWKITRVDSAERVKTLVPYGTPVQ